MITPLLYVEHFDTTRETLVSQTACALALAASILDSPSIHVRPTQSPTIPSPTFRSPSVSTTITTTDVGRRRLELDAESDCTGSTSEVWDATTGEWVSTFYTLDEQTHNLDMFYMEEVDGMNELWVTEIEEWMAPSLYNQLQYNYVKLSLECPSSTVVESCVIFKPR